MKRRSHRLPIEDTPIENTPQEDWVDESWTVDCVCGVNFDDGEEMVNCDECGVWVHTRCSRYVKGEKSFACHKCKLKNDREESEETEVAQLLADLPTKSYRMDHSNLPTVPLNKRRPWLDLPMAQRVHVQGVPGGDPSLFSDVSPIYSPQLWKSTGYIPKKFNSQYREFPCWDIEENENIADGLLSLSEENKSPNLNARLISSNGVENPIENGKCEKLVCEEKIEKSEGEDLETKDPRFRRLPRSIMNYTKRKKEDTSNSRDRSEKKKARISEHEGDLKKKDTLALIPDDGKQSDTNEDKDPKAVNGDDMNSTPVDHSLNGTEKTNDNDKKHASLNEHDLETNGCDAIKSSNICDEISKESDESQLAFKVKSSAKVNTVAVSESLQDEVVKDTLDSSDGNRGGWVGPLKLVPIVESPKVKDSQNGDIISTSSQSNPEAKPESNENQNLSENVIVKDSTISISSSEQSDPKVSDIEPSLGHKHGTKSSKENQRRVVVSVGKSCVSPRESSEGILGKRREREREREKEKVSSDIVKEDEMSPKSKKSSKSSKYFHKRNLPDSNQSSKGQSGPTKTTSPLHTSEAALKVNTSPVSSNPTGTTLSDEELALLLHQELNSSSRVPRVPRMRHAGSLPHLTSPTGASVGAKRTSSSGGKDYTSTNRRKGKDSGSRDVCSEAKKMDRVPSSSPDSES